jgi:imidazolonepropionase-like amidohydrolase
MGEDIYVAPINRLQTPALILDARQPGEWSILIRLGSGVDPCWEQEGKQLSWTYGNRFYTVDMDKVMAAAAITGKKNKEAAWPSEDIVDVGIQPDRIIDLEVTAPKWYGHGLLVLKNVRILTMQGDRVIEKGTIVIKDGRFVAVGDKNSIAIPPGAKVLDLPGVTVMPGMVDMHAHIRLALDVFPQQSWMYLAALAYGVTTWRDPASSFDSFGYTELLETGQMTGPRLYSVGRAVSTGLYRSYIEGNVKLDELHDLLSITQKRAALGGTCIKQYSLRTRGQREGLLLAASQTGLNMTNEGDFDLAGQLAMIKDGSTGIEHCPDFGDVYNDVTLFMARSGTFLTPTLQVNYSSNLARSYNNKTYWHQPDEKMRRFLPVDAIETAVNMKPEDSTHAGFQYPSMIYADIRHQGGLVTLGSHSEDFGIGVHNELWALQMGGLSNMEALQAATILGARAIGIQKDLGSIEPGKIADLVILNKNPLDDIHNSREIRYVMKDGVLYDGNTLDTIWPVARKCPDWKMHQPMATGR